MNLFSSSVPFNMRRHILFIQLVWCSICTATLVDLGYDEDLELWKKGSKAYVEYFNLTYQNYTYQTADNVTLGIARISNPRIKTEKIPILFMHGLVTNSDTWLLNKPASDAPMVFAENGYDIWLMNLRGALYSPINKDQTRRTSLDDNIRYDLPATIDFVLSKTGFSSLTLVSVSKGAYVSMALLANQTDYNKKVRLHVSLVPVTLLENPRLTFKTVFLLLRPLTYLLGANLAAIIDTNPLQRIARLPYFPKILDVLVNEFPLLAYGIINGAFSKISLEPSHIDKKLLEKILTRAAPGAVFGRELMQFSQNSFSKRFQTYTDGWIKRDLFQWTPKTIEYDLANITTKHIIIQAEYDISTERDYKRMRNQLCSVLLEGKLSTGKYDFKINLPNYNHLDILAAKNNQNVYVNALYMMIRENDLLVDKNNAASLPAIDYDMSHLVPQNCSNKSN